MFLQKPLYLYFFWIENWVNEKGSEKKKAYFQKKKTKKNGGGRGDIYPEKRSF